MSMLAITLVQRFERVVDPVYKMNGIRAVQSRDGKQLVQFSMMAQDREVGSVHDEVVDLS